MVINKENVKEFGLYYDADNKSYVYCAKQLNKYLKKCLGVSLCDYSNQKKYISLGYNDKSEKLIDKVSKTTLKKSGFRIVFENGNVYIYGLSELGTVYGVFEFLERYLGVKFLTSVDEITPKIDSINIDEIDVECNPCFEQRECAHFSYMINPDFALKRRYEGPSVPNNVEAGLTLNKWYNKISNSHNSFSYVSKDKYLSTHPEMFAKAGEKNEEKFVNETWSSITSELCYSNGLNEDGSVDESLEISTVKVAADSLYKFITEDTNIKYFMFGKQDCEYAICHCQQCAAKREKYGGEAGAMIIFLNAVIDLVEKRIIAEGKEPDFQLATFAYVQTVKPPVDENYKPIDNLVIPHKRLHIRYAPLRKNFAFSNEDVRQDEETKEALLGWSSLTKNIMIWDYSIFYIDSLYFSPVYLHLAKDIDYYNRIGVSYLMYEEEYSGVQNYHIEMDSYVMSKLFWNPKLNVYDLMKEYIDGFYGVAAEYVYKYRCLMLDFVENIINTKQGFRFNPVDSATELLNPSTYPIEFLTECVDVLESGLKAIDNSDLTLGDKLRLTKRVKLVLLSPLRAIAKGKEIYFGNKQSDYVDKFYKYISDTGYLLSFVPLKILEENNTKYKIMLDKSNKELYQYANYLNEWFKNKVGVELEIVNWDATYPTYMAKVICLGYNDFSKEFFKGVNFDEYNVFVKNRGWSIFLAGEDLKSSCDIFLDRLQVGSGFKNHVKITSLTLPFTEITECKN